MELDYIFTTPIASGFLDLDNGILEQFCKEAIRTTSKGAANQSGSLDLTSPELQPLLQEVHIRLNEMWKTLGFKTSLQLKIRRAWTTINNSAEIDLAHCHPDSVFTAVYYVRGDGTPDNGNLILVSPVTSLQHVLPPEAIETRNRFNSWNCAIVPETGKLVMFPSWIVHQVARNKVPTDRLSIAIDAVIDLANK